MLDRNRQLGDDRVIPVDSDYPDLDESPYPNPFRPPGRLSPNHVSSPPQQEVTSSDMLSGDGKVIVAVAVMFGALVIFLVVFIPRVIKTLLSPIDGQ